ncbi:MAG: DUF2161 family putative PD-(D/E)XK-type phosphodiesterase [Pelosinus sp.]|nr:DUF2161 family putative PD-(D/E)XK-type phosphodiesterase [Pelosinus sp.]
MKKILETDLYPPLYSYLVGQGYTVRSEVKDCDIIATQGEEMLAIEMKRSFTLTLVLQAVKRQRLADSVYVAIPRPHSGMRSKSWQEMCHLLKRLELGLIVISLQGNPCVEVVFHPLPFVPRQNKKARQSILREVAGRSGDYNVAGSSGRKLMTAYREKSIHIACCLERLGPLSPKELRKLGTADKSADILRNNYYGWFERVARGVYEITAKGKAALTQYRELAEYYEGKLNSMVEEEKKSI